MRKNFKWLLALVAMVASVNLMAAITSPWSHTFASGDITTSAQQSKSLSNINWAIDAATYVGSDATKGFQIGSSNSPQKSDWTMSTAISSFGANVKITSVSIKISTASKGGITYKIEVGDQSKTESLGATTTVTEKTLNNISVSSGNIKITLNSNDKSKAIYIKSIKVTFEENSSSKTLTAVTVSGNPTKTTYNEGESFDPAGLTVKGTYDDASEETITSGITWSYETTDVLAKKQTSINVKATVDEVTSANWYTVSGLTVNAHQVTPGTYEIALNKDLYGIATADNVAAEQSAKAHDITIVSGCSSSASSKTYYAADHIRYYTDSYLKLSVPAGYLITSVVFAEPSSDKKWNGSITSTPDSYNADTKTWSGSSQTVDFAFGAQNRAASITVTYIQDIKSAITFDNPANGTLTIKNGEAILSSGAEVSQTTVLDVTATRASAAYRLKEIKVVKTEGSDDVTFDVYDATTGKLTMPAYAITVSATMEDNNYLVTFHSNTTPAQEDKTQTFTYTKAANLTANAFTAPTGYEFFKWATTVQGEGTIADGAEYTLASEANADLYAKWVAKTIEVTLKANGSGTDGVALVDYDATAVGNIEHVAAWAEHELLGYYTAATEGDKILNADGTFAGDVEGWIVNGKWAKTADCELFAQWKAIEKYGISYNLTGCTANAGNPTEIALADESVTLNFDLAQNYTWDEALISVTMGGKDLPEEDYTFDAGELLIMPTGGFKGNIEAIIYCDFAPATLTLKENGSDRPYGENLKVNSQVTLPNCDVTCDKTFMGWSTSNTDHSNLMAAGSEYTLTSTAVTLYAWFATETPGSEQTVFSENFNVCEGKGANDSEGWSGGSIAGTDMPSSITGWTFANAKAAYQCAKFGTTSKQGSAQTPALNCTGDGVLTFKAGAWDANDEVTGLTISATEGVSLKDAEGNAISSVTMTKGAWTTYTVYVYGMETSSKITFAAGTNKNNRFFLDEVVLKQAGTPSYSDYALTCSAKASAPVFSLAENTYTTAQTLTITAEQGATIYYTTDGSNPDNTKTLYEGAISLDTYGKVTVKAIAYVAEKDPSDVVTKEYMMNLPFTSLEQLVAANVQSGTEITITFPKTQIKSLAGTKGVYFNIQKEGKDIEIYAGENRPDNYEAGGYLKATNLTCDWVRYPATGDLTCWELTPSDWSAFEYSDPDPFTSVAALYAAGLTDGSKVYLNITNAYVHGKTFTNPNNFVYVQDGEVGIVLRTSETIADENIGKLMTAKIVGNLAYSNGRPQIAVSSLSEVSYTNGDRPTAKTTTLSAGEEATQILSLVKFDGFYAQSQNKQAKTAVITENADGTGASYTIYNLFGALKTVPESDKAINVKGLFYKKVESNVTSYSIVPVLVEDVALVTPADATLPTLNIDGGSQAEPVSVGLNEVITITPATGFTAYYKVNDATEWTEITKQVESITLTADTKLEVKSTRDYYTDATATYYYKIDASLTKYAITIPSLSKTHASVEASVASELAGQTITITISNVEEHFSVKNVSVVKTADIKQSAADVTNVSDGVYTFTMPACDVTINVSYNQEKRYSIDYQKGRIQAEGEDITEAAQYEGTILTLKECTWTSDNYIFKGWKALYNNGESDVELPIINNQITVPAYDVKIIAQWNKIASYDWVLVTDANQLAAGDYVVIASNAQGKVASSTISSSVMGEVDATFSAEKDYLNSVPTGAAVLTLGGTASAWTLSDKDGHKLGATAVKKVAWDSGTQTWTIAIDGTSHNATIQNTTDTYGRFLHNVNNNRFTTYTSGTSNIMLLPQLYKAVEHTYVVKYHLNGGANKPADSHADADGKVTITTDVPTYTAHKFLGWNAEQDGSGQEYVGGQEYTIEDDITIYAQWQEVSKYTVTYIANGATEGTAPTETDKYEASKFSVKGQGELEYPDYIFRGWSDGENIYQEGDEYTMPNHAVEFTAQWESTLDTHWALVYNLSQLEDGDKVIIAAANYAVALGAESGNTQYREKVEIVKSSKKFFLSELTTTPTELTLGIVDGKYTFHDGVGYLYAAGGATSKQNWLNVEDELDEEGMWTITISHGIASIESVGNEYVPVMSYNNSNPRFSCYTQVQGSGETAGTLAIYKYYEKVPSYETRENLSEGAIGTICYDNTILAVDGGTLYQPNYKDDAVKNIYFSEPDAYTAGLPMIFQADAEELVLVVSADPETQVDEPISDIEITRGMVGDLDEDNRLVPSGMYIFTQNKLWIVDQNCYVDKNRAYVDLNYVPFSDGELSHELPNGAPRKTICLGNASSATPTNLNGLKGNVKAMKVMQDGQFYIIRDAKIFNAQGIKVQ